MKKTECYSYIWADGGIVCYTVTDVTPKIIWVMFDNGVENYFSVGSPMHLNSKKI